MTTQRIALILAATCAAVVSMTPVRAQTSSPTAAVGLGLDALVRRELRSIDRSAQGPSGLLAMKAAPAAPGWAFSGTIGLGAFRSRGDTWGLSTPVALGWEHAADGTLYAMSLESDGWIRQTGDESIGGMADILAGMSATQALGKDMFGKLRFAAVLPTRGEVGSRKPSALMETTLVAKVASATQVIAVWGLSGNGDGVGALGATTQALTLVAVHPLGPGKVSAAVSRSLSRSGIGGTVSQLRWDLQMSPALTATFRAVDARGDDTLFGNYGVSIERAF